ncbi:polyunsaturated fatty acid 5-lipoxygenase-like isoform X2 [Heptranchias perlo]|uniref:polyunsaturated fatty acid 5-lipoxygenase-like isoform X2 n=1 Tax=Heptranchias perlo TaxID=212740 RepID=UPI00355A5AEB
MVTYKVTFRTGTAECSGTDSYVHCTLIGERGPSQKTIVDKRLQNDLERGAVDQYDVTSDKDLGTIWFVELEVTRFLVPDYWFLGQDYWFCNSVTVETPSGQTFHFPCYRWLDDCTIRLREGTAKRVCDDKLPIFQSHRQEELQERQKLYRWEVWAPNMPRCIDARSEGNLPMDLRFSCEKQRDFKSSLVVAFGDLHLKKFVNMFGQSWTTVEDFDKIFWRVNSPIAALAREHWKEDWFFGYQFMNGFNPVLIQKCANIPMNFPVSDAMVRKSLGNSTLEQEIKNGNIFIVNYKMLEGIPANVINGVQQYLAAPICLLYLDKQNHMMPIAIQLKQTPGGDNPIFLPSDPELDWLLAKTWVRCADVQHLELISHLQRTHLIAETFCIATIRQLPSVHPIYKLLIPHTKYTIQINTRSRFNLLAKDGIISNTFAVGAKGHILLSQKEFLALTYQLLCLPENLEQRGLQELKGCYYKDDGLQIWSAIHKFVTKIVRFYYENDQQVKDDPELQAWIKDLTGIGFQDLKNSGIPISFHTRMELCKFLTMVIFTCSAQHAAVNNGQYDWGAWVPNSPCSMRKPPPTTKGTVTMEHIMETLPDITQSCIQMAISWTLCRPQPGMRELGNYEEYFTEEAVKKIIGEFQEELKGIDRTIQERNGGLALKYENLRPINIENSITI